MTGMKYAVRISILIVLFLSLGGLPTFAQFLSGIDGTVKDHSGAFIAGAKVTITDTPAWGRQEAITTSDAGYFRIDSIAASTYKVQIQMTGFKILGAEGPCYFRRGDSNDCPSAAGRISNHRGHCFRFGGFR